MLLDVASISPSAMSRSPTGLISLPLPSHENPRAFFDLYSYARCEPKVSSSMSQNIGKLSLRFVTTVSESIKVRDVP